MRALIQDVAQATQARDRQGKVILSIKGTLFTLIVRTFLVGLGLLFLVGFTGLIINLIINGISQDVSFGIMDGNY
tara:strand:- start:319 stop:543 length:225 start_codon:yes stop_codon:yes gene_type:complete